MNSGGCAYSEQDVKATLDNCRLTYVYEPDRRRLHGRVSQILGAGMLVAWFQGSAGTAPGVVPGRTVICDPSNRWARENMNRFFKQVPIDTPLTLVAAVGTAPWHDAQLHCSAPQRIVVDAAWRTHVVGAIDRDGCVGAQGIAESDESQLLDVIRDHQARTGVPALIAVPFCAPSEPVVRSPRDAIRAMFSSSVDVMVIERFVIAKDQWILGMPVVEH